MDRWYSGNRSTHPGFLALAGSAKEEKARIESQEIGCEEESRALGHGEDRSDNSMKQSIGLMALVVRDYDEALDFYVGTLGFSLIEDTYIPEQDKRWVVIEPPGSEKARVSLPRCKRRTVQPDWESNRRPRFSFPLHG